MTTRPTQGPTEPADPSQTVAGRITVGFLVAGLFLVGVVALVALAAFLYSLGLPLFVVAVLGVVVMAGVFAALRRWAAS